MFQGVSRGFRRVPGDFKGIRGIPGVSGKFTGVSRELQGVSMVFQRRSR